jgi:hypothetical protein
MGAEKLASWKLGPEPETLDHVNSNLIPTFEFDFFFSFGISVCHQNKECLRILCSN